MRSLICWNRISFIFFFFLLVIFLILIQPEDIKAQNNSLHLGNRYLLGMEVKTVEEVLSLPDDQIDLATAILLLSKEAYQNLYQINIDVSEYLDIIDKVAQIFISKIGNEKDPEKIIENMNNFFFQELELEYIGEGEGIASFLNFVIDECKGNCLGLSILYLTVSERIGFPLYGVTAPRHFFVRYKDSQKQYNIDPASNGETLSDDYYINKLKIPMSNPFYLKNLDKRGSIGVFYNNRGVVYRDNGLYDQAIADYNKALEINPEKPEAYMNRGVAYSNQGFFDKAIADINKSMELYPNDAEAYINRGATYNNNGFYDQAIADYNKALEINPEFADAYYNRGNSFSKKGLYNEAVTDFNKYIEINPWDFEAYLNKALACENADRIDEAMEAYQKFIQNAPLEYPSYVIELIKDQIQVLGKELGG